MIGLVFPTLCLTFFVCSLGRGRGEATHYLRWMRHLVPECATRNCPEKKAVPVAAYTLVYRYIYHPVFIL